MVKRMGKQGSFREDGEGLRTGKDAEGPGWLGWDLSTFSTLGACASPPPLPSQHLLPAPSASVLTGPFRISLLPPDSLKDLCEYDGPTGSSRGLSCLQILGPTCKVPLTAQGAIFQGVQALGHQHL